MTQVKRTIDMRWLLSSAVLALGALSASASTLVAPASAALKRTANGHVVSYQPNVPTVAAMHRASRALGAGTVAPPASSATRAPIAYKPCSGFDAACLSYYGGPVMRTTTLTPIFWKPSGSTATYPAKFKEEIEQFFTGVAADAGKETNFFSVLTQYHDEGPVQYGVTSEPALTDEDALSGSIANGEQCATPFKGTSWPCVTDLGLRKELNTYVTEEKLPTGLGHEYVVFLPDGFDVCFGEGGEPGGIPSDECSGTGFCGYHTTLQLSGGNGEVQYAVEPENAQYAFNLSDLRKEPPEFVFQSGGVEVCTTRKGLEAGAETLSSTSHEISESVTDPEPEGKLAWYDFNEVVGSLYPESEYAEIGDMCAYEYEQGEPAGRSFRNEFVEPKASNQTIDGHTYLLQTEWDNAHGACSISEAATTTASFTTSPETAVSTGESISFDAGASKAPTGIASYEWNWGDGTTTSSATPSATHAYSSTGGEQERTFRVTLKVTDAKGNTDVSAGTVEVLDRSPHAAFTAPGSITAGAAATFDGSGSSDPDGAIASYSWSFGDGTPIQAGSTSSHTFAAAGAYTVTLTVTDDAGQAVQVSHAVVVAAVSGTSSSTSTSPGTGTGVQSGPPSNKIEVVRVKRNADGSLLVTIKVPGAGSLSAHDASVSAHSAGVGLFARLAITFASKRKRSHKKLVALVAPVSLNLPGAGEVTLHLIPTSAGRRVLAVKHRLSVSVIYTFTPVGGTPGSLKRSYVSTRAKKARKHH